MPEAIDPHLLRTMRSNRSGGAVGGLNRPPVLYPLVRTLLLPHHTILDFGAGHRAIHTLALRQDGYDVTAWDHPENQQPGLHDPDALKRRYHVVVASNVLNTQDTKAHLARTLNQIANSVNPAGGFAIANFPSSPRYDAFKGMAPHDAVAKLEVALKRRFKSVERHPSSSGREPIWILKSPRYQHSPQ